MLGRVSKVCGKAHAKMGAVAEAGRENTGPEDAGRESAEPEDAVTGRRGMLASERGRGIAAMGVTGEEEHPTSE